MNKTVTIKNKWVSAGNVYPPEMDQQNYSLHFSSKLEFIEFCKTEESRRNGMKSSHKKGSGWSDTKSFSECIKFAENGSPEHKKKFLKMAAEYKIDSIVSNDTSKVIDYAPAGAVPDIGRYVSGDLCHMATPKTRPAKPIIKIALNVSASSGVSSESLFNKGLAALSVIDEIEASGMASVELHLYECAESDGKFFLASVPVKRAGEIVDIDSLSFLVCSSSTLRRLFLKITETVPCDDFLASLSSGYGTPVHKPESVSKFDNYLDQFDVVFSKGGDISYKKAVEFIKSTLNKGKAVNL